ncbi:MAG: ABC transporter permease [Thermoanaerobaculales bacterium]|nr:ABC transporter permease [Thermoanaerobaculales bacterium]
MSAPRRLRVGAGSLGLLVVACLAGPWVLPVAPAADPARAALLPPGAVVTEVTTIDGRAYVSPEVEVEGETVTVAGPRRDEVLARTDVASMRRVRLWLGSDRFGRDVLGQLLAGGRISVAVAALAALVALVVGTGVGLAAASAGGAVDAAIMRLVDALLAFPTLFLLILLAALFRPGPAVLVAVLGLSSWMGLSRLVRGQVLALRGRDFVLAARAAGATEGRIWRRHYLPNIAGPLAQDAALRLGDLVLAESTLSFLGIGLPPDLPTWGGMVAEGHRVMVDGWWLATLPGLAIALLVISLALLGDGIQERLATGAA